ncbi:MAG TPA: response regulator transcription factor [Pyrinomonadaceae bacterium]|jgi:DNA-binding NarL/FixJ family response regulator|nr:response regulator transcription factor [Pyrinomonadaceae bacterium]
MIRVLIVEDQTLVREGIERLLNLADDISVVERATDGAEALEKLRASAPDVILLDVRMPKMTGIEFLRSLQETGDSTPTILLTTFDDDAALLNGIRLGAKGYLLKDVSLTTLTEAIRLVAQGGTMISPVVTERLLQGFKNAPVPAWQEYLEGELTLRETEILRLMTGGFSNRELANALEISEGTVKNHVSNILGKLGVRDRTRAVLKAIEKGYI